MPDQSAPRFPRVRQIEALNAQTGPVLVAYPTAPELDELLARVAQGTPDSDALADDGVRHAIWPVRDAATIARITALFDAMPALYISDGHHRSAAAARVFAGRRQANPRHTGEESYNSLLVVAFPHHALRILDYNRVVRDLHGLSIDAFLAKLREKFTLTPSATAVKPTRHGDFGLYCGGRWHRMTLRTDLAAVADAGEVMPPKSTWFDPKLADGLVSLVLD